MPDTAEPSRRMLTSQEAAGYTGIPYSTWTKQYKLWEVAYFKIGRRVWFREAEVEAWLQEHHWSGGDQLQLLSTSRARSNACGRK
jgi:excisionase family DNA binding protein